MNVLDKSRELIKTDEEAQFMLIDLYVKHKEWGKAEQIAQQVLQTTEKKALAYFTLAQLSAGQGKYQLAIEQFEKTLEITPAAMNAVSGLVNSYLALNKVSEAEKVLDQRLQAETDHPVLLSLRAKLHAQQEQLPEAEALLVKVLEIKPEATQSYKNLASFYLVQKKFDQAIAVYQKGLDKQPENIGFLMQVGILNTIKGDSEKAIIAYHKVLEKTPDNLLAVNNISALLADSGDKNQQQQADKIVQPLKDSESGFYLDTYGWVMLKNGKIDLAVDALENSVLKQPKIAEIRYHMAMAYLAAGRKDEARQEFKKAVAEGANYKGLDIARAELEKLQE